MSRRPDMLRAWRVVVGAVIAWALWLGKATGDQAFPDAATVETRHGIATRVLARRLSSAVSVDGRLDEDAWLGVPASSDFHQRDPDEAQPATEHTEVRVAYDSLRLYIGIRLFDREPGRIERRFSRRDSLAGDTVAVYVDSRHDHLTGALFQVSAAGVESDATIYNDFQLDESWDAIWKSAVSLDEEGWTVEIEIPLSQLRFNQGSTAVWGFNVERFIHRKNESAWLQVVPKDEKWLASRMAHLLGLEGIASQQHLEVLPYLAQRAELIAAETGNPFNDGARHFGSTGLDLKWAPSNAFALDATFNPDFGQVEVDASVINLTEFEPSFEEKRPFFLEGEQMFTNFGRNGSGSSPLSHDMFYSRRIGREPQGESDATFVDAATSTTILGAIKLTGKTGNGWSVGLLEAMTDEERARVSADGQTSSVVIEPRANYLAARMLKEGRRAGAGILTTAVHRSLEGTGLEGRLPRAAYATGFDGYVFLDSQRAWVLSGMAAGSHVAGTPAAIMRQQRSSRRYFQRPDATYVRLSSDANALSGWSGMLNVRRLNGSLRLDASAAATNPEFEVNDLGFQRRADEIETAAAVTWAKYTPDRLTRQRSLSARKTWRWNFGGVKQRDAWSVDASLTFLNYWYANGGFSINLSAMDDHLTRGGPLAAAPRSARGYLSFGTDGRHRVWVGSSSTYDRNEAGGWGVTQSLSLAVRPSQRVRLSLGPYLYRGRSVAQFVDAMLDPFADRTGGSRYVFADLGQTQLSMKSRADLALTPSVSLQLYVEPFIGVGQSRGFRELAAPRTYSFLRYGQDIGTVAFDAERQVYTIDPDAADAAEAFRIENDDFNFKSLRAKAVFRWEWRPGSTLYVAWTQTRFDDRHAGDFNLGRDVRATFRAPADDVLMVKVSYWFSR